MTATTLQYVFWFTAGLLSALAAAFIIAPWFVGMDVPLRARWGKLRRPLLAAATLVSLAGVSLYGLWGAPNQLSPHGARDAMPLLASSAPGTQAAGSMDEVRARLEQRLTQRGGTPEDWELLAKTYEFLGRAADAARARTLHQVAGQDALAGAQISAPSASAPSADPIPLTSSPTAIKEPASSTRAQVLLSSADAARRAGRYGQASQMYRQLADLHALDAQGWADYADVAASLQGGRLAGEPERLIDTALERDPSNQKALWLKGSLQHETGRYTAAIDTWRTLLRLVPADSSDARIFTTNLAEDDALAGSHTTAIARNGEPLAVRGQVLLSDALRASVPAGSTLYVVARSVTSPGPPVAVLRVPTSRWPLAFQLDDTLAMLPGRTLSAAGEVAVQARISRSGQALPTAGDLQSAEQRVEPRTASALNLIIDQVVR